MILTLLLGLSGTLMRPDNNATRYLNFVNNNVKAEPFIICVYSTQNWVEWKIQIV